ncbi:MAG: serine hydrolase, partial [Rhizomicrobium sp.]
MRSARILMATLLAACVSTAGHAADDKARIKAVIDAAVRPMMEKYNIPGMAVGVTANGKSYTFDYGVVSRETKKPVTP